MSAAYPQLIYPPSGTEANFRVARLSGEQTQLHMCYGIEVRDGRDMLGGERWAPCRLPTDSVIWQMCRVLEELTLAQREHDTQQSAAWVELGALTLMLGRYEIEITEQPDIAEQIAEIHSQVRALLRDVRSALGTMREQLRACGHEAAYSASLRGQLATLLQATADETPSQS